MRFLCLHGQGTNAEILQAQTDSFRRLLPDFYEYYFLEAEYECGPGAGIDGVFPGPYYWYYPVPVLAGGLARAHAKVLDVIEEEGPFDGILGFSQGAALASSLLLHHQTAYPEEPPLFRLAVFMCASLPFSLDARDKRGPLGFQPRSSSISSASSESSSGTSSDSEDFDYDSILTDITTLQLNKDKELDYQRPLERFDPAHDLARIQMTTVHIIGQTDPWAPQSRSLVKLCAPPSGGVFTCTHRQGHNIPRDAGTSAKIAQTIERAIQHSLQL